MFDDIKKINIDYIQLLKTKLPLNEPFLLTIDWLNVKYEFLVRIKNDSPNLLIFGSGAYQPSTMTLPLFHRHSWINNIHDSILFYNDPTLYLGKISLGWGHGNSERFYLEDISKLLHILASIMNIPNQRIFFYGSSAGGFMSLILSGFIKNSTAIVNNPQKNLSKYRENNVNTLFKHAHPGMKKEDILKTYADRINVIEFFKKINYVPKIYYLQNVKSKEDIENQLLPFIIGLQEIDENIISNSIQLDLYSNENEGHNPLGKQKTIDYLNKIVSLKK